MTGRGIDQVLPNPSDPRYRMHPDNAGWLTAARLDCCVLANNHVLDFGYTGLLETLETLCNVGLASAGAGRDGSEAAAPAIVDLGAKGRVLVFAFGCETSGVPFIWSAGEDKPGINMLSELSAKAAGDTAARIAEYRRPEDIVVASIHWGGNWGYAVPRSQRTFAHALIDSGCVHCVHGHSSHHAKGIEVYRDRPIIYGCGDFLDDYEGISGHEHYRGDLSLMYFVTVESAKHELLSIEIVPAQRRRFSLAEASAVALSESRSRVVGKPSRIVNIGRALRAGPGSVPEDTRSSSANCDRLACAYRPLIERTGPRVSGCRQLSASLASARHCRQRSRARHCRNSSTRRGRTATRSRSASPSAPARVFRSCPHTRCWGREDAGSKSRQ
jgi:poly-gamma-glutamate capsule biosynthesis protein CapA/YwtB (metallophosphatase superfamily)